MRDYKMVATADSRRADTLTVCMLAASTAAFWCLNIWTMFNWGEGMVLQKLVIQTFTWLHTIVLWRHLNR